ncbi:DUF1206 domain-containing protein [Microbacteriaceae bacterium VKM Ac-2854]|nr:DUF1206 domain-containing protein [Microbacteriaceae bacterium VKM Ac-2854]
MSTSDHARRAARATTGAARDVGNSRALEILARVGFAASALVHLLLGAVAIRVAFTGQGQSDQSGALAEIAKFPGGAILLWIVVVGLFALGLWLIVQAVLGIGSSSKKRWMRSLVSLGKALAYVALGVTALSFAQGKAASSSDSTQQASSTLLTLPGGQLLLGAVGVLAAGIGGYFVFKGVTRRFRDDLTLPVGRVGRVVVAAGITGYIAKGVAVFVVGVLFVVAAATVDPGNATGLDGALKSLASLTFGAIILTAVGIGLIAYGLYTFVRARYARL